LEAGGKKERESESDFVGFGRACLGMERKKRTALPDVGGRRKERE